MCGQSDDPTQYDPPTPTRPRVYDLAGEKREPRGSVALAVIGEMLTEAEAISTSVPQSLAFRVEVETLRRARDRIAKAEAALVEPYPTKPYVGWDGREYEAAE